MSHVELGMFYTVLIPVLILIFKMYFVLNLGCQAGLEFSEPFPSGRFAVCESCKLGRGKCRKECLENEKPDGSCRLNFLCCRQRV
uniref:Beta-defensin n=1 Tax=Papio anubis TaxID=9555 RepID=A0A8I5NHT5_PAPAN